MHSESFRLEEKSEACIADRDCLEFVIGRAIEGGGWAHLVVLCEA